MTLINEIIKSDKDRLFIVDYDCLIIFTGDTDEDDKPFIRLGNWSDMPVSLIPIIENIVITDNIMGSPANEQFNIDIRELSLNRYIGSENIVKRYLQFQTIFGLDLQNANIVNIEKDIPELSNEKILSAKNQYIGYFYRDGNFKTLHNRKTIVDLKEQSNDIISHNEIHSALHETNKDTTRYKGTGIIIIDNDPFFYSDSYFTTYQFPLEYIKDFSQLEIDPQKIREIIHPSNNFINVTKLLKWNHAISGKLRLFSDHKQVVQTMKQLFSNCNIIHENFTKFQHNTGSGLSIKQYSNSFNIKLTFQSVSPSGKNLKVAFIKGPLGIKTILNDSLDAICINYSAFEDVNLLFKAKKIPIIVTDDGNTNISKLIHSDYTILWEGMQYEFIKPTDIESVISASGLSDEIITTILGDENPDTIFQSIPETLETNKDLMVIYNIINLINVQISFTTDRKRSSHLKGLLKKAQDLIDYKQLHSYQSEFVIQLLFFENNVFEFIRIIKNNKKNILEFSDTIEDSMDFQSISSSHIKKFCTQVLKDRKRLYALLDLISQSASYKKQFKETLPLLDKAINLRKEVYKSDAPEVNFINVFDENGTLNKEEKSGTTYMIKNDGSVHKQKRTILKNLFSEKPEKRKKQLLLLLLLPLLIILTIVTFTFKDKIFKSELTDGIEKKLHAKNNSKSKTNGQKKDKKTDPKDTKLTETRKPLDAKKIVHIKVLHKDIYRYVNKIAMKNGYSPIPYNRFGKNPHWIYPGNIFIMTDGEKIVVERGDTIWKLAKKKLLLMSLKFDALIKEINNTKDNTKIQKLIKKAKTFTITERNRKILEDTINGLHNGK